MNISGIEVDDEGEAGEVHERRVVCVHNDTVVDFAFGNAVPSRESIVLKVRHIYSG